MGMATVRIGPNFAGQEIIEMAPACSAKLGPICARNFGCLRFFVFLMLSMGMTTARIGPNLTGHEIIEMAPACSAKLGTICARNFGCLRFFCFLDVIDGNQILPCKE